MGEPGIFVGSRGFMEVALGGRVETPLLEIGSDGNRFSNFSATRGEGAEVVIADPDSLLNANFIGVSSDFEGKGSLTVSNQAITIADTIVVRESGSLTIESGAELIAQSLEVGPAKEDGSVTSAAGMLIDQAGSRVIAEFVTIGDVTRSGIFEPLPTYALLAVNDAQLVGTQEIIVANGGALLGVFAKINGPTTVYAGGLLSPGQSPGLMTFQDDLTLLPGSKLLLEVGGDAPGTGFDQLEVLGNLSGETEIEINFLPGYVPAANETFSFFKTGLGNLSIADVQVVAPHLDLDFQLEFEGNLDFTVLAATPVPVPASLMLLVAPLLSLVCATKTNRRLNRATQCI